MDLLMKQNVWWSPNGSDGTLLSHRWVQAFVFELPPLKHAELQKTLRYKVQAMLPVNTEGLARCRQGRSEIGKRPRKCGFALVGVRAGEYISSIRPGMRRLVITPPE